MKSSYINKGRKNNFKILFSLILSMAALFAFSANAFAAMGMPGDNGVGIANGMDRGMGNDRGTRMGEGLDNNIPEGGVPTPSDTVHGNLGDTDGDGVVEDKGTGEGIIGDIGDMGSEIVSDIGDGLGDGTKAPDTNKTPEDSGMANETEGRAGTVVAIVIAVLVAIALIILILVLIPRDKNKRR